MEKDILTLLTEKIDTLLLKYDFLNKENNELKECITNLNLEKEKLDAENAELKETIALKDLELEEIVGKIESILG